MTATLATCRRPRRRALERDAADGDERRRVPCSRPKWRTRRRPLQPRTPTTGSASSFDVVDYTGPYATYAGRAWSARLSCSGVCVEMPSASFGATGARAPAARRPGRRGRCRRRRRARDRAGRSRRAGRPPRRRAAAAPQERERALGRSRSWRAAAARRPRARTAAAKRDGIEASLLERVEIDDGVEAAHGVARTTRTARRQPSPIFVTSTSAVTRLPPPASGGENASTSPRRLRPRAGRATRPGRGARSAEQRLAAKKSSRLPFVSIGPETTRSAPATRRVAERPPSLEGRDTST